MISKTQKQVRNIRGCLISRAQYYLEYFIITSNTEENTFRVFDSLHYYDCLTFH